MNCHPPGARSKSRALSTVPGHSTTRGSADHPSHPLTHLSGHPTLTPFKGPAWPPAWGASKGICFLFLGCSKRPGKPR